MSALVALQGMLMLTGVQICRTMEADGQTMDTTLAAYLSTYYRMLRCTLAFLNNSEWLKDDDDITVEELPDSLFASK